MPLLPLFTQYDLPPLLRDLIQKAGTSPSLEQTSQGHLAKGPPADIQDAPGFFDAINAAEAVAIYSAVRTIRPTASVEIGFCCAGSGLAILKALADNRHGMHYVCDPYQSTYAKGAGLKNVAAAGLQYRLQFHEAFPEEILPRLPRIQFAFIDASHLFDLSILDFVLVEKRLDVGGVVAFHDMWMPSLQKVVRFILNNRAFRLYAVPGANRQRPAGSRFRWLVAKLLRCLPRAEAIFTQEILVPWTDFGLDNLVFLEKTKEDSRDWRHFSRF